MNDTSTKKNISYNMIYQVLVMILPFITAPYLSRVIGKEGTGIYSYTYSIAHYFVLFSMLGLANYGNRSIAQARDDEKRLSKTFSEIYTMQMMCALLSVCVFVLGVLLFGQEYTSIFLIQTMLVASSLFDISWLFYGMEQFKMMVIRNATVKIATTLSIFILVRTSADLWKYAAVMSFGTLCSQFVLWTRIPKFTKYKRPHMRDVWLHVKPNIVLFIPVAAVSLYRVMDKIMLGFMSTMGETGLYENSDKLVNLPMTVITSIGTVMMPKMANLYARGDQNNSRIYIRDSMQLVIALSCGMSFGMAVIAERFAPLYFGSEFTESGFLIKILSPIVIFASIANVIRTQYLIPKAKDKEYIFSVLAGAVVNFIINSICIPGLGSVGAAIGTIAAEFTVMFIQCVQTRKELDFISYIKDGWIFLASGAVMYTVVRITDRFIPVSLLGIFLQIIIGVVAFGIISAGMLWVTQRERFNHIMGLLVRRKK